VQFPFRLLSLAIPAVSFLAACIVSIFPHKIKIALGLAILCLVVVSAIPYLFPKSYQYLPDSFYSTNQDKTTVKNEYMPVWAKEISQQMVSSKVENLNGKEAVSLIQAAPNKTVFTAFLASERIVQINTLYFPGWYAFVNGKPAEILYNNPKGLISLRLDKGMNNVQVVFRETPVRLFSDLISIISMLGLVTFILIRKKIKL
jgi:hypothetical protein